MPYLYKRDDFVYSDKLFEIFSKVFVEMKTRGLSGIDRVDSEAAVYKYLNFGIDLIKEGLLLIEQSIELEYEFMLLIRRNNFNEEDLLQLTLIKYIIPLIFSDDYDTFLSIAKRYGSTSLNDNLVKVAIQYQLSPFLSSVYDESLLEKMQKNI